MNDMNRCIRWVLIGTIILLFCGIVCAEPISGWHPSARDYFTVPGVGQNTGDISVPIVPQAAPSQSHAAEMNMSSSVTSESLGTIQTEGATEARILVRYNTSEVSALADVQIEGVALQQDLGDALPGLALFSTKGRNEDEAIKALSSLPGVLYAEPDYIVSVDNTPNDPEFWRQWGLSNNGQVYREGIPPGTTGSDGKFLNAWDISTSSGDVIVAVLDTGVDYTHPELAPNMWTGPSGEHGYNVITDTPDPMDDFGHGTHCAGIIGASGNNGIGITGAAWKTKIMAVKAIGSNGKAYISDIIKGIEYAAANNADIISCSFGGGDYSQSLYDAISGSHALFICAAGNNGMNNDQKPYYPASYTLSNIIGVASTAADDTLFPSSNYGTSVHLAAPGGHIYSTMITRPGGNRYAYLNGTSQATAVVAGMSALVLDKDADLTPQNIRTLFIENSDKIPALNGKVAANGRVNLTAVMNLFLEKDEIVLKSGWNFVSVPRPLAAGSDTAMIFAKVSSGGHSVLDYINPDGWKPLKGSDLITIMTGYWVYSTKDDTVPLKYKNSPEPVRKYIKSGWNTYGLPSKESIAAKTALNSIQSIWKYVVGYDSSLQKYDTPIMNGGQGDQDDDRMLRPFQGYWLYSAGNGEISG